MKLTYDLNRFLTAQDEVYNQVLEELQTGEKISSWMWYIFPQIQGLGTSARSQQFAIQSIEEAVAYLKHPILGPRLEECNHIVFSEQRYTIDQIFGYPDYLKFRSSITLFAYVHHQRATSIFQQNLEKYYDGREDLYTITILNNLES